MNCKKILIVTSEFPPQPGGIGNHAYNLALQLCHANYDVTVLCDNRSKNGEEESVFDNHQPFAIQRVERKSLMFLTYLSRLLKYFKILPKVDCVIASGKFSLWLVGLTYQFRKKRIAVIHGSEVNFKGLKKRLIGKSLKRFNNIIAVSNHTNYLIDYLNLDNVTVISNGVVLNEKQDGITKILSQEIKLVTVGNVTERKGQINIINALPNLIQQFPKMEYHIVGLPTDKQMLMAVAKELKVDKHIKFHGRLSELEKQNVLKYCDIFVMLSNITAKGDIEGFGIAILEANAIGLPAIGSNNSGITDAILSGFSGELIAPKNRDELVIAVAQIISNYSEYSENSMEWSKKFNWKIIIDKYIEIIE